MEITKKQVLENLENVKKYIEEIEKEENVKEKKKINITIKNRWTGDIIFESEKTTYREAIEEAINTDADLRDANLEGADLTRANLKGADLTRANLRDANLEGADLTRANLTRANLKGADLTDADLTDANLTRANLTACLLYFGNGHRNFEALCKAIKTIRHPDGKFEDFTS